MRNNDFIMNSVVGGSLVAVKYYPADSETFSAKRQIFLTGVFDSPFVDGTVSLIRWDKLNWSATIPTGSRLLVYVRSGGENDLVSAAWNGPFLNGIKEDISFYTQQYFQLRLVLSGDGWQSDSDVGVSPLVREFSIQGILRGNEEKLYTKAFDVGFIPKHFIVTYNGSIPAETIMNFAVAGDDTINPDSYRNVDPNTIQSIGDLPDLSGKIKLMVSALGCKAAPFEISKIGLFVSGGGQTLLNQ
jgi:hypothetical protein